MRYFSSSSSDPYKVLGVPRSASAKEIKLAYYKKAKESHPDLNPGDSQASLRFRQYSEAYELLHDPARRAQYDRTGRTQDPSQHHEQHHNVYDADAQARATFESLWEDVNVLQDALSTYVVDLRDEVSESWQGARKGEWGRALHTLREHKVPLAVGLALVASLRFPFLILPAGTFALRFFAQNPRLAVALGYTLFRAAVRSAKKKKQRKRKY